MRYNVRFITDRVVLTTTVEADDEGEAHSQGLETIRCDLDLNLIGMPYQIEYEELDTEDKPRPDWEDALEDVLFGFAKMRKENSSD